MPHSISIRTDVPLSLHVDAEARFARFPPSFTIKGMFLARLCAMASPATLSTLESKLLKPAALNRYMPFSDYPQVDYSRLAHAVALESFRDLQIAEAMRHVARRDIQTFGQSQVGRVMLALSGDATATLMKLPEMYRAALRGGTVETTRRSAHTVAIHFRDFYGWVDCYPIGTVEGLAEHFSRACEIEVSLETDIAATYVVRLT